MQSSSLLHIMFLHWIRLFATHCELALKKKTPRKECFPHLQTFVQSPLLYGDLISHICVFLVLFTCSSSLMALQFQQFRFEDSRVEGTDLKGKKRSWGKVLILAGEEEGFSGPPNNMIYWAELQVDSCATLYFWLWLWEFVHKESETSSSSFFLRT